MHILFVRKCKNNEVVYKNQDTLKKGIHIVHMNISNTIQYNLMYFKASHFFKLNWTQHQLWMDNIEVGACDRKRNKTVQNDITCYKSNRWKQLTNAPPTCFPVQENQAPAADRNSLENHYFFDCCCSDKLDLLNLLNLLDLLDLLYILETYLP